MESMTTKLPWATTVGGKIVALHSVRYRRAKTAHRKLCVKGGVLQQVSHQRAAEFRAEQAAASQAGGAQ